MRGRMVSLLKGPSLPSSNLRWLMMSLRLVMPLCVIVGGSIRPVGHAHGLLVRLGSALVRQCAVPTGEARGQESPLLYGSCRLSLRQVYNKSYRGSV
jgi:hypothetical protein